LNLLFFGPLQGFIFGLPGVNLVHGLVKFSLDIVVVLVHRFNLFEGLVVLALDIGVDFRDLLLVVVQFTSLALDEFLELVTFLFVLVTLESSFGEFLDLDFIAVAVEVFSGYFFQPASTQKNLSL
jgi:hypothetical protein